MRRKITLAFLILAAFLLQTTVFQYFQIASVTPNLLLILTSAFGLMRGKKEGLMVGFFSGLMIDLFYGSLFGFYALLYMYIGYLNGFFCKVFYDDDIKVHIVLVAASDLVYSLLMYVLYGDEELTDIADQNTVSKTVELIVNEDIQDFCLNEYFPELTDKRLTGISTAGRCPGYFDLTGNENRLENVPAHFFEIKSSKGFQLVPMNINLSQSWYRHRSFSHEPFSLTLSFLP